MPAKKPPFTFEQHASWGMKLALITDEFEQLRTDLEASYRTTDTRRVQSLISKLGQVRHTLDEKLAAEHIGEPGEAQALYYPTREARDALTDS